MFDKLIGNDRIKNILRLLLARQRVPNALLFAGEEGVGKQQFALELARAFICSNTRDNEACGVCAACRRVGDFDIPEPTDKNKDDFKKVFFGNHIDVGKVVAYRRAILVDAIRDLERCANFQPYEAPERFFIIDDADKMNEEASNALLKTLEEPPPTSHIFLISSRPESLLPTIRSRCQTLRFEPVATEEIEQFLIQTEKISPRDATLIARLSAGSIGNALSMDVDDLRSRRQILLRLLQNAVINGDRAGILRISEEINDAKNKENFEDALGLLEILLHDILTLGLKGNENKLINIDLLPKLTILAENAQTRQIARWMNELELVRQSLAVNINKRIATDALFVGMAA